MIITNIKCDNQVKGWKVRSSRRLLKIGTMVLIESMIEPFSRIAIRRRTASRATGKACQC